MARVTFAVVCFVCLMLLASTSLVESTAISIFILAGQSNMVGLGGVKNGTWDGVTPPECRPNPRILRLTNDYLSWEEAHEPLHQGILANVSAWGIGPGMPFANLLLERDPSVGVIGLVPCAFGGTKISQWSGGSFLYDRLVNRARAAMMNGGILRGILWYQGEGDTHNPDDAHSYKRRFEEFVADVRYDLGSPLLPVIEVALASGVVESNIEIVRKAQFESAHELPHVDCVDAKGLELEPDHLHLATAAQVQLGRLMAEAFLQCRVRP